MRHKLFIYYSLTSLPGVISLTCKFYSIQRTIEQVKYLRVKSQSHVSYEIQKVTQSKACVEHDNSLHDLASNCLLNDEYGTVCLEENKSYCYGSKLALDSYIAFR